MVVEVQGSPIARDLKLNLKRVLEESALTQEEGHLALLALSTAAGNREFAAEARAFLTAAGMRPEEVQEAAECAALMGMLNTYYRFRHMLGNGSAEYGAARLRMLSLSSPVLGKERFEMLAFALSVFNGCEKCIQSHESVLRTGGAEMHKLHDLARLASIVKGLQVLGDAGYETKA